MTWANVVDFFISERSRFVTARRSTWAVSPDERSHKLAHGTALILRRSASRDTRRRDRTYGDLAVRARASEANLRDGAVFAPGRRGPSSATTPVRSIAALLALHARPLHRGADRDNRGRRGAHPSRRRPVDWVVGFDADEVRIVEGPGLGRDSTRCCSRSAGPASPASSCSAAEAPESRRRWCTILTASSTGFARAKPETINILVFLMFDTSRATTRCSRPGHRVPRRRPDSRDPELVCALRTTRGPRSAASAYVLESNADERVARKHAPWARSPW